MNKGNLYNFSIKCYYNNAISNKVNYLKNKVFLLKRILDKLEASRHAEICYLRMMSLIRFVTFLSVIPHSRVATPRDV